MLGICRHKKSFIRTELVLDLNVPLTLDVSSESGPANEVLTLVDIILEILAEFTVSTPIRLKCRPSPSYKK